jgi:hypothetical protein
VDKYEKGSHWLPHYDTAPDGTVPVATITVFLSVPSEAAEEGSSGGGDGYPFGGYLVFPTTELGEPIAVRPVRGLAVVHHNADESNEFDPYTAHAQLPPGSAMYVATKHIFHAPVSKARRTVLPALAALNGGRLPRWVSSLHESMAGQFGHDDGGKYFDKLCFFAPMLVLLTLVQYVVDYATKQLRQKSAPAKVVAAVPPPAPASRGTNGNSSSSKLPPAEKSKRSKTDKKRA